MQTMVFVHFLGWGEVVGVNGHHQFLGARAPLELARVKKNKKNKKNETVLE